MRADLRQVVNESLRLDWLQPRRTPQGLVESHIGSRVRDGTFAVWFGDPYRALHGHDSAQLNVRWTNAIAALAVLHSSTSTTGSDAFRTSFLRQRSHCMCMFDHSPALPDTYSWRTGLLLGQHPEAGRLLHSPHPPLRRCAHTSSAALRLIHSWAQACS